jgi:hypothetical protein
MRLAWRVRAIAVGRAKFLNAGSFRLGDALERYGESRRPAIVQWVRPPTVVGCGGIGVKRCGGLADCRYLLHDRDTKYTASFLAIIKSGHVKTLRLPARSPNLNAFSERWVRSVKEECLSRSFCLVKLPCGKR